MKALTLAFVTSKSLILVFKKNPENLLFRINRDFYLLVPYIYLFPHFYEIKPAEFWNNFPISSTE
jgi:hypothetical protein